MNKLLLPFLLLVAVATGQARNQASSSYTTQTIVVSGDRYDVSFNVWWGCDDFPMISAPGQVQLVNAGGQLVAEVAASIYSDGPSYTTGAQNTVTDLNWWVATYTSGGEVADGSLSATWHLTGLTPGTYTLRLWRYATWSTQYSATTVWTQTSFLSGSDPAPTPSNHAPAVTLDSPGDQTVTAGTSLTITSHATDPDGNLTNHNVDIQRPAGDWNWQGGFAAGEPFQGGPVGSGGDSTRTANFTFTDVGTYTVRAAADDGSGWVHSASVTVTVVAAVQVQFTLNAIAGPGGTVSGGGRFDAGSVVTVSAAADGTHDFSSWSGDAGGTGNPVTVVMDRDKTVQANFTPKLFALTTSATAGGGVTPGGSYPPGTSVTVAATPDVTHHFVGWTGNASGTVPSIVVTLTGPLSVQAVFADKAAQTITFSPPGSQPVGGPALSLDGTSSSGLPVAYSVLGGPAVIAGGRIQIMGPGMVTVQASQDGDGYYLPAPAVVRTFNAVAAAQVRYRPAGRTLFQSAAAPTGTLFVLEKP